ncbi:MAG: ABC transporter ATP-binding protein [Thermaceae bacterium]|nr:ABC transporter ATP-binding protein [Thermaceae bacterium]
MSFEVRAGEILSVIGPNGAGKSTLFKMIAGALKPNSGEIYFDSRRITGQPQHIVAQKGVVRTFQETTIFREMSALEHVVIAHHLQATSGAWGAFVNSGRSRREEEAIRQSAAEILNYLGLGHVQNEAAKNLPHGYLRALGIAMALAAKPKLLLLDEPFAGMNPEETDRAIEMVRGICMRGVTVLLVEHDMRAVMRISHRIVAVSFGRKIAEGSPQEIQNNPSVIEAYLGREDDELGI